MTQGTQTEALQQPRGEGGGWEVQEFQEGEDIKKKFITPPPSNNLTFLVNLFFDFVLGFLFVSSHH